MKRTVSIFLALVLLLVGCSGGEQDSVPQSPSSSATTGSGDSSSGLPTVTIKEVEVQVEIADGLYEQARGLMGRTELAGDRGMLFVYDSEQTLSFWMKGTLIPLSIAFMDSEGRIIDIQDMKPLDDEEPHYVSSEPAQYALEVNQGFFEEHGIEVGDRAELPD